MESFNIDSSEIQSSHNAYLDRLLVKNSDRMVFIDLDEVEWIESSGNYIKLNLSEDDYLVRGSLKNLETHLNPLQFVRIHRSCIVNIDMIKAIEAWFSGDSKVILKNRETLKMSRNYKENLDKFKLN